MEPADSSILFVLEYHFLKVCLKEFNCSLLRKMFAKIYTILPKVLGRPLLMNRFDYFSNFYEYKS